MEWIIPPSFVVCSRIQSQTLWRISDQDSEHQQSVTRDHMASLNPIHQCALLQRIDPSQDAVYVSNLNRMKS